MPVPVLVARDGTRYAEDEAPEPVPFVRAEQEKRLRRAEKDLKVLGRVNPLALEEFDAMTERHAFLAEQLEDLRRTRKDLADIITEVDNRVEQVFAEAYADVEKAFAGVFATLFPGGEGRLVLTEPGGQWLTTGVDVEARPPGKKVKRLSLLSGGGERSLVAVAFLVSLFIARPSPFYILDEVEAALDDVNLGAAAGDLRAVAGELPAVGDHPPEADDGDRRRAVRGGDHARGGRGGLHGDLPADARIGSGPASGVRGALDPGQQDVEGEGELGVGIAAPPSWCTWVAIAIMPGTPRRTRPGSGPARVVPRGGRGWGRPQW